MKFQVVIENTGTVIRLVPESVAERMLLGSAVSNKTDAVVEVEWDGHETYNKAKSVGIRL